jgi:hypothetical protein
MPNKSLPKRECGIAFPLNASPVSGNYQHRVGMSTNPPEATGSLALPRAGTWKKFNGALRDNLSVDETNSEPRIKGHWAIVGTLKKGMPDDCNSNFFDKSARLFPNDRCDGWAPV